MAATIDERCSAVPLAIRDQLLAWADAMDGGPLASAEAGKRSWRETCGDAPFRAPWVGTASAAEPFWTACGAASLTPFGDAQSFAAAGGPESAVAAATLYRAFAGGDAVDAAREVVDIMAFRASGAEASTWGRHAVRLGGEGLIAAPAAPALVGGACQPMLQVGRDGVRVEGGEPRSTADPRWLAATRADLDWLYREAAEQCAFAVGNGVLVAASPQAEVGTVDAVLRILALAGETTASLVVAREGTPVGTEVFPTEFGRVGAWTLDLRPAPRSGGWVDLLPFGFDVGAGGHRRFPVARCGPTSSVTVCPSNGTWDWAGLDAVMPAAPVDVGLHRDARMDVVVALLDRAQRAGRLPARLPWRVVDPGLVSLDVPARQPALWREGTLVTAVVDGPVEAAVAVDLLLGELADCAVDTSGKPIRILAEAGPEAPVLAVEPVVAGDRSAAGCLWDVMSRVRLPTAGHFTVSLETTKSARGAAPGR